MHICSVCSCVYTKMNSYMCVACVCSRTREELAMASELALLDSETSLCLQMRKELLNVVCDSVTYWWLGFCHPHS